VRQRNKDCWRIYGIQSSRARVARLSQSDLRTERSGTLARSLDPGDYTAERAVSRAADAGAICVKVFVESRFGTFNWPYLRTETLQKIRIAATQRNLILLVHATSVDSWRSALDAHADIIAHGLWVWPGDFGNPVPPPAAIKVIAAAALAGTYVQPTLQTVAGERAMIDPSLLDDPRLPMALPPAVIGYLKSPEGVRARNASLDEYRKASPSPGFEPLLAATIERTHATLRIMLRDKVPIIFGSDTPSVDVRQPTGPQRAARIAELGRRGGAAIYNFARRDARQRKGTESIDRARFHRGWQESGLAPAQAKSAREYFSIRLDRNNISQWRAGRPRRTPWTRLARGMPSQTASIRVGVAATSIL
jgi:hypothetical protein